MWSDPKTDNVEIILHAKPFVRREGMYATIRDHEIINAAGVGVGVERLRRPGAGSRRYGVAYAGCDHCAGSSNPDSCRRYAADDDRTADTGRVGDAGRARRSRSRPTG